MPAEEAQDAASLRDALLGPCQKAATAILEVRRRLLQDNEIRSRLKGDRSPVTEADQAAHQVLLRELPEVRDLPVVSEESSEHSTPDGPYWLVDPLDGTKEFLAGREEFTVNVALVHGPSGRVLHGVVQCPVTGETFAGGPGVGAWRLEERTWRRIQAGSLTQGEPCRVVVSRSHRTGPIEGFTTNLREAGHQVDERSYGSSLKLCRVASAEAHVYPRFGPTMAWDTAAAHAVVAGAGGSVTDIHGEPLTYRSTADKNPWFIAGGRTWRPWHTFVPPGA